MANNNMKSFAYNFFKKGHPRTIKAKKNIIASFGLKGFSILVSFLLVPLTLNYLNPTKYGIWLTLSSIVGWFGFFDIGLGNGLRNKLAEAFALKDYKRAKTYVSTTYVILSLIIGSAYLFFLVINTFINWAKLLNTAPDMVGELSWIALIVFTFFAIRFVLKLIGVIFTADQLPVFNNIFGTYGFWTYGREIEMWVDGKQTRSFLYIDECLEGVRRLMQSDWTGPVNIGSEEMVSINELAQMVMDIAGKKLTIKHIPGPLGVRGRKSDNKLIKEKLGWKPNYPLQKGLEKTYLWIEGNVQSKVNK